MFFLRQTLSASSIDLASIASAKPTSAYGSGTCLQRLFLGDCLFLGGWNGRGRGFWAVPFCAKLASSSSDSEDCPYFRDNEVRVCRSVKRETERSRAG